MDSLNSLLRLETLIITQPTAVSSLPHPNSVRCMKIHYLPKYSEDWHWVASIQGLEVLDVSFMDTNSKPLDSSRLAHGEHIRVDGQKAICTKLTAEGAGNILRHLPQGMRVKVLRCLFDVEFICTVVYSIAFIKNKTIFF